LRNEYPVQVSVAARQFCTGESARQQAVKPAQAEAVMALPARSRTERKAGSLLWASDRRQEGFGLILSVPAASATLNVVSASMKKGVSRSARLPPLQKEGGIETDAECGLAEDL